MRVLVTAAAFPCGISGVQRHACNLVRCLLHLPEIEEVHLAIGPWQSHTLQRAGIVSGDRLTVHVVQMPQGSIGRNIWYYRGLPRLVRQLCPSIVHLSYPVPVDTARIHCPVVMTLHDLYPFEIPNNFGFPQVLFNRSILRRSLRVVSAIACVSATTFRHLSAIGELSAVAKSLVIQNCVEPGLQFALHSPLPCWSGEPFLLCVAQHRRNKNIDIALGSFHRLLLAGLLPPKARFVIVGIRGPESVRLERVVRDFALQQNVSFLEGLSDAELQWCYARCEALIAPSQVEGFGLPIAEAMLAGCRVVCSDIEAFREIGRDACHYSSLEGDAVANLTLTIAAALQSSPPAPVAMPELSSAIVGLQYLRLYQELLAVRSDIAVRKGTALMAPCPDTNFTLAPQRRGR